MSFDPLPAAALANRGRVATLGMLIIDHFEVRDESGEAVPCDAEVMGGGGLYAATAARMFLPPNNVGFIADVGDDLPLAFRAQLESLGSMVGFRRREDGLTTRALNMYSGSRIGEGHQSFKYLTPRRQLFPVDYAEPSCPIRNVEWLHVVCDEARADRILREVHCLQRMGKWWKLAWEPLIRTAEPADTARYVELANAFDVFSPNHLELQTILGTDAGVEECAAQFTSLSTCPAIVVRAGERGAYTLTKQWTGWVPAFWRAGEEAHIVDVTGGGNSFMGGLLAGLFLTDDYRAASIYGSTAASFAIEQRGIPALSTQAGVERWNGCDVWDRLREMAKRVDKA